MARHIFLNKKQPMISPGGGPPPAVINTPLVPVKRVFVLLLACLGIALSANAATLFSQGSSWRWRPGTSEASSPVTAWRLDGFNDSEFVSAPSPFWYDNTGDSSTLIGGTKI